MKGSELAYVEGEIEKQESIQDGSWVLLDNFTPFPEIIRSAENRNGNA